MEADQNTLTIFFLLSPPPELNITDATFVIVQFCPKRLIMGVNIDPFTVVGCYVPE